MMDWLRHFAQTMLKDRGRLFLTLLGVSVGSGSLVFLSCMLHAATFAIESSNQEASGSDITQIEAQRAPPDSSRVPPGLSPSDVSGLARREGISEDQASGIQTSFRSRAAVGKKSKWVGVVGAGPGYAHLVGAKLAHGRWPEAQEAGRRVCVIGWDLWQGLFGGAWPLADPNLVLDGAEVLTVVGVLQAKPAMAAVSGEGTWRVDRRIFLSLETYQRIVDPTRLYDAISLRHRSRGPDGKTREPAAVARELSGYLLNLHRGVKDFEFEALGKGAGLDRVIALAMAVVLLGAGLFSTVVGVINVMNSQWIGVAERTVEYGIRRALGASGRRIRAEVLLETLLLMGGASFVGVASGLGLAKALSSLVTKLWIPWPFQVDGWALGAAAVGTLLCGLVAGWWPAKRASELHIVECLREPAS